MRGIAIVMMVSLGAKAAAAEPAIGTTLQVGESLHGDAGTRVGTTLYAVEDLGGWFLGGELSGSFGGYMGGWGCGTAMPTGDYDVPAVAGACMQPSVAGHALIGVRAMPTPWSQLRLAGGLGAASLWLLPFAGAKDQREIRMSGLIRVDYLVGVGRALGARWWVGASLEERASGVADTRLSRALGVVIEGR